MSQTFKFDSASATATIQAKLGSLQNVLFKTVSDKIFDGVIKIHADAVLSINAHSSVSKVEKRYNPKRDQEVSAPGNAPNNDLGTLQQSIAFEVDQDTLTGVVGTNLLYGAYLEMGTAKMKPRPWLFPAFESNRDSIKSDLEDALNNSIKGIGA